MGRHSRDFDDGDDDGGRTRRIEPQGRQSTRRGSQDALPGPDSRSDWTPRLYTSGTGTQSFDQAQNDGRLASERRSPSRDDSYGLNTQEPGRRPRHQHGHVQDFEKTLTQINELPLRPADPAAQRPPVRSSTASSDLSSSGLSQNILDFIDIPVGSFVQCEQFVQEDHSILKATDENFIKAAVLARALGNNTLVQQCAQRLVLIKQLNAASQADRKTYVADLSSKGRKGKDVQKEFYLAVNRVIEHVNKQPRPTIEPSRVRRPSLTHQGSHGRPSYSNISYSGTSLTTSPDQNKYTQAEQPLYTRGNEGSYRKGNENYPTGRNEDTYSRGYGGGYSGGHEGGYSERYSRGNDERHLGGNEEDDSGGYDAGYSRGNNGPSGTTQHGYSQGYHRPSETSSSFNPTVHTTSHQGYPPNQHPTYSYPNSPGFPRNVTSNVQQPFTSAAATTGSAGRPAISYDIPRQGPITTSHQGGQSQGLRDGVHTDRNQRRRRTSDYSQSSDQPYHLSSMPGGHSRYSVGGLENVQYRGKNQIVNSSTLDPGYVLQEDVKAFFINGRVFAMLYHENKGIPPPSQRRTDDSRRNSRYETIGPLGEIIFSHIRRFAISSPRQGYCRCVPINSYGGRGAGGKNMKDEIAAHAIIYDAGLKSVPPKLAGESRITKDAIAVDLEDDEELDAASRIHFGKVQSVEYNVRVKNIGVIAPRSLVFFNNYWRHELNSS